MRTSRLAPMTLAVALLLAYQHGPSRLTGEDKPAAKAGADHELHIVGIHEGFTRSDGKVHGGKALVNVKRPGKGVTLVLTAYNSITWEVTADPGTRLEHVILAGYHQQVVKGVPNNAQVTKGFREEGGGDFPFYASKLDSPQFRGLIEALDRAKRFKKAASFHGAYSAKPGEPIVVDRVQDDPRLSIDWPTPGPLGDLPRLTFKAAHLTSGKYGHETALAFGDFTLNGPKMDSLKPAPKGVARMTYDPDGKKCYGVADAGHTIVEFDPGSLAVKKLKMGLEVPRLNTPSDLTFDTKRKRLLVNATSCIYAYTPATGKWEVLADEFRASAMVYHPREDVLYALQKEYEAPPSLVKLNPEGAVLGKTKLEGPIVPGTLPRGPGISGVQLVHSNGHLVLVVWPGGLHQHSEEGPSPNKYIYLVDPATGKARLTWKDPPGAAEEKGAEAERTLRLKARDVQIHPVEVSLITLSFTVSVRSKNAPIDAYLVPQEEAAKAAAALAAGKPPSGFVAAVQGVEDEASFTVSLKGKQPLSLVVRNTAGVATEASVTVTAR